MTELKVALGTTLLVAIVWVILLKLFSLRLGKTKEIGTMTMKVTVAVTVEGLVGGVVRVVNHTGTVELDSVSRRTVFWDNVGRNLIHAALDEFEGHLVPTAETEESEEDATE